MAVIRVVAFICLVLCPSLFAEGAAVDGSFLFDSNVPRLNRAYQDARAVIAGNIKEGRFYAGTNWQQVWTRDTAYSVDLACGLIHPEVSRTTLLGLKEYVWGIGECWLQDTCGHFAGWPHLTDAIAGAVGAWSLYRITGDAALLKSSYRRTVNSLKRADRDAYNRAIGLYGGCSTFMESNSGYPAKYAFNGALLAKTFALSTNVLYYEGWRIAAAMGAVIGEDVRAFQERAVRLKDAINARLWMPRNGCYAYYLDENGVPSGHREGCGEAFAVLWGVAGPEQAGQVLRSMHITPWGIPCQWPQYPEWMNYAAGDAEYYHNGMIWPFVQGYWAWAAVRRKDIDAYERELNALMALHEKDGGYREFYRPEGGEPDGSPDQLWSASGFCAMVLHGLLGMEFETGGIRFAPVVPQELQWLSMRNLVYRDGRLTVIVTGHGARIVSFTIDGEQRGDCRVPASITGDHEIGILLSP